MHEDLRFIIHFYTNKDYLLIPITSYNKNKYNMACDSIIRDKSWFMERYRIDDRNDYYQRRIFVENQMKIDYEKKYQRLKSINPVYFYLIPKINNEKAKDMCLYREKYNENSNYILLETERIISHAGVSFTINDSFTAYCKKAIDAGIKCRPEEYDRPIYDDHNTIFAINEINSIYEKYINYGTNFEIQIWNSGLINEIRNCLTTAST